MVASTSDPFGTWLAQAQIRDARLTPDQRGLLQFVFRFRQSKGTDYYSNRLLSHFLLHCECGLKIAQIARLSGFNRQTASGQQDRSSKEAIQQAHHRMDGRPYGKLLPRYAGPIAGYVFAHPTATRADLLDFIDRTFGVRVSRIALYHFLKKFGLTPPPGSADTPAHASVEASPNGVPEHPPENLPELPAGRPIPSPPPPFSSPARTTPGRSSSSPRR
jgi:transposase